MSFKGKYFKCWNKEELKEWIQEIRVFDIKTKSDISTIIEIKGYNGCDFTECKDEDEIKSLFNNIYDEWCMDDKVGWNLYSQVQSAKFIYPVISHDGDDDDDNKEDENMIMVDSNNDVEQPQYLISWTSLHLIQWVKSLQFTSTDEQLLISQIRTNEIDGYAVDQCDDAKDVAKLFKLDTESGQILFGRIKKIPNKKRKKKQSFWDKNVFEWNTNDVTNWIKSLGSNMSQYTHYFTKRNVNGLSLILLLLDTNPYSHIFTFFPSSDSKYFMRNLQALGKKYNITEKELKIKKKESKFGLIGLENQGNTCFMNTAIQLILQSPGIYQQLDADNDNNNDNDDNSDDKQYGKFDPRRLLPNKKGADNNNSMISFFIDLHNKSMKHEHNSTKPRLIFNRICEIDRKYKKKDQQDSAAVMSLILLDIDQDLNNHVINQNNDEKDDNDDDDYNIEIPFISTIAVKQILSKEQEEMIIHERLLKRHNPYNTMIRKVMDGVQRVILTCMDCNWQRVEYDTFRAIKLPLINNEMSINVKIYIPNQKQPIIQVFNLERYTKIYVLKHQIGQLISDYIDNINNISIDNIIIGSIIPTNYKNSDCIDNWIRFYDANKKCSELSSAINVFATIQQNLNSKLITIFDIKIDRNERIIHDECRFVEVIPNLKYKGSDLFHSIIGVQHNNKNNICISLQNRTIDIMDNTEYMINCSTNSLILIEMENDELRSKLFPSLSEFRTNNGAEQIVIEGCINGYNKVHQQNIKYISLNEMINGLRENLKYAKLNSNFYRKSLKNVLTIAEAQNMSTNNIIKYLRKSLSMNNKNVINKPILNDISQCLKEYEREKILDHDCSQMFCKKCGKNPKVFKEQISIIYSPLNLTFRIERGNDKPIYNDKFNHLVKYPYKNVLVLSNNNKYNLYGVAVHSSGNTLKSGHYYAYIKSIYSDQWYEISDSSIYRIASNPNQIQNKEAIILMYTKSQ